MAITVLHIEDNYAYHESLKMYLENFHGILITAIVDTSEEAIEILKNQDFDFIFVDMSLYGNEWAGIDIIKDIRKFTKAYIIVLSGSTLQRQRVHEAYEVGAYAYEYKMYMEKIPIVINEILQGIYTPMYYITEDKIKHLKEEQKTIFEDLQNKLTPKEISKKHKKSYKATINQISRIKKKLGLTWNYIFGKK